MNYKKASWVLKQVLKMYTRIKKSNRHTRAFNNSSCWLPLLLLLSPSSSLPASPLASVKKSATHVEQTVARGDSTIQTFPLYVYTYDSAGKPLKKLKTPIRMNVRIYRIKHQSLLVVVRTCVLAHSHLSYSELFVCKIFANVTKRNSYEPKSMERMSQQQSLMHSHYGKWVELIYD